METKSEESTDRRRDGVICIKSLGASRLKNSQRRFTLTKTESDPWKSSDSFQKEVGLDLNNLIVSLYQ